MVHVFRRSWRWFEPKLAGASRRDRLIACVGAAIGIGLTGWLCEIMLEPAAVPWLVAPLGASAVLLFAVPTSPLAQPWSIVGGNSLSALVGVIAAANISSAPLAAGLAVGGAILIMSLTRCLHPPGGAAALTAVIGGKSIGALGFLFPFVPVGLNSLILVLFALLFHRMSGHSYPHRPPVAAENPSEFADTLRVKPSDIELALEDFGEALDIARDDLEALFGRVEHHMRERVAKPGSDQR